MRDYTTTADYELMKEWLPKDVKSILDIGCGWARIDVFLARHYGGAIDVHLLDGEMQSQLVVKERTGYRQNPEPWKDRNIGVKLLRRNVPECAVYGHPPDPSLTIPADLIISTRSWGHHYPVSLYIELAKRSLQKDGRIILDIRNGTDGLNVLEEHGFKLLSGNIERRSKKCQRFVLSRD